MTESFAAVDQWTRPDPQAAGGWLTAAQESPTKPAAVTNYTLAEAPYAPATAAQWALTLRALAAAYKTCDV